MKAILWVGRRLAKKWKSKGLVDGKGSDGDDEQM